MRSNMKSYVLESDHLPDHIKNIDTTNRVEIANVISTDKNLAENQNNKQASSAFYRKKVDDAEKEAIESAVPLPPKS